VEFKWSVVFEYRDILLLGIVRTAEIFAVSTVLSLLLGTLIGMLRTSQKLLLRQLGGLYVEVFRNIPVLIQMMFFYFAIGLHSFWAAVIGLSLYTGGYIAETVRSVITAVARGQKEAALASGLSTLQAHGSIVLPQAFMYAIPPLTTELLNILKNSSVAMVVGVQDLTFTAREIETATFRGVEAAATVTVLYIALSAVIIGSVGILERILGVRAKLGERGRRSEIEE